MSLRHLKEVLVYAEQCKLLVTCERIAYFDHVVIIEGKKFLIKEEAIKCIDILRLTIH